MKNILIGITFAMFWASASVATKVALAFVPPLVLANTRFFLAGCILLAFYFITRKNKKNYLPQKRDLKHIAIFGLFNSSLYACLYVYAMKFTDAGIGSLSVSINPLLIVLLSAWLMNRKSNYTEWICIFLGISGIALASYPLLKGSTTTFTGLFLLFSSMLTVSYASVYYAKINPQLDNLFINGVQLIFGALFLFPFTLGITSASEISINSSVILALLWLSIGVSIIGLSCWFYLLKRDAVNASLWLFLCPVFGFFYAWWLMDEPITLFTVFGTLLVIAGLSISQYVKRKQLKLSRG